MVAQPVERRAELGEGNMAVKPDPMRRAGHRRELVMASGDRLVGMAAGMAGGGAGAGGSTNWEGVTIGGSSGGSYTSASDVLKRQ